MYLLSKISIENEDKIVSGISFRLDDVYVRHVYYCQTPEHTWQYMLDAKFYFSSMETGKVEKVIDWDEFLIFIQENEIFGRIDYKQSVKFMVCSYPAYLISNLITYRGVARCESQDPIDDWNFFRNIKSKIVTPSSAVKSGAVVRFIEFDKLGWGGDKTFKAEYTGELIYRILTEVSSVDLPRSLRLSQGKLYIPCYKLVEGDSWENDVISTKTGLPKKVKNVTWKIQKLGELVYSIDDIKSFKQILFACTSRSSNG